MLADKFLYGRITFAEANKALQVVNNGQPCLNGLQLKTLSSNAGIVYIGYSDVSVGTGFPLEPGDGLFIPITYTRGVYCLPANAGDILSWFLI